MSKRIVWEQWEDDLLREFYPNCKRIREKLYYRSVAGIRARAKKLGLMDTEHCGNCLSKALAKVGRLVNDQKRAKHRINQFKNVDLNKYRQPVKEEE
jgi:hypothetical protein